MANIRSSFRFRSSRAHVVVTASPSAWRNSFQRRCDHLRSWRIRHASGWRAEVGVLLLLALSQAQARNNEQPSAGFVVGDIRIEGLQRIAEGTVLNSLPINVGDRLDTRHIQEAIRSLFATGFFQDVELRRDGGTLLVVVLERPSIEKFEIKGNKDVKT